MLYIIRRISDAACKAKAKTKSLIFAWPALCLGVCLSLASPVLAADILKVSALKYGTVDWLLDVIKEHKLDEREGFTLQITDLASNGALQIALLGKEADAIVTDWFWALRERARGEDFVFTPYSATLGSVIAPPNSAIASVSDLKGKKIGVAGGPLDKSWLILRADGLKAGAGDLAATATPVFAAPPLLNHQLQSGDLDAALNFWHFNAPLEGAGFKRIASVNALMKDLGLDATVPLIGFVFRASFAASQPKTINGFVRAVIAAQSVLIESDAEWERLRPRMKAASDAEFTALRNGYREGVLSHWGPAEREAAAKLFEIVAAAGGAKMVGEGVKFDKALFWDGLVY
jgi:NitT/TauT family transport system substrate-binding protein